MRKMITEWMGSIWYSSAARAAGARAVLARTVTRDRTRLRRLSMSSPGVGAGLPEAAPSRSILPRLTVALNGRRPVNCRLFLLVVPEVHRHEMIWPSRLAAAAAQVTEPSRAILVAPLERPT